MKRKFADFCWAKCPKTKELRLKKSSFWNGFFANVIPNAFPTLDFNPPICFAIPVLQGESFPFGLRVIDDRLQSW